MSLYFGEYGSNTSLTSSRDLSQEDGGEESSTASSSLDTHSAAAATMDDGERLAMLASAVKWIKGELAAMRDCDRGILQQLLTAHSTITDIREQQNLALKEEQQELNLTVTSFNSTENLDEEELESSGGHSDYFSHGAKTPNSTLSQDTPPDGLSKTSLASTSNKNEDDEILRQFFGEEKVAKLNCLSRSSLTTDKKNVNITDSATSSQQKTPDHQRTAKEQGRTKTVAEMKMEAKKEGRSSLSVEMQLLRQKLQEEAKMELAAFDREFDSPRSVPSVFETEKRSYRHSILNRMDELLNPSSAKQDGPRPTSNHIRQSSEPVVLSDIIWEQPPAPNYSPVESKRTLFPTSQSVQFVHSRKVSEPAHSSFRLPSSRPSLELTRTGSGNLGSGGSSGRREDTGPRYGGGVPVRQKSAPHYDTTVIRRRSSSRNNTLEKKRHPLQYSVESLDSDETGLSPPLDQYNGGRHNEDFNDLEHKTVSAGKLPMTPPQVPAKKKYESMPRTNQPDRPKLTPLRSYQPYQINNTQSPPEVYPEMSPSPPPVVSPSRTPRSPPYNGYQQQQQQYVGSEPKHRQLRKPLSAPLKKKNFVHKNTENSWL